MFAYHEALKCDNYHFVGIPWHESYLAAPICHICLINFFVCCKLVVGVYSHHRHLVLVAWLRDAALAPANFIVLLGGILAFCSEKAGLTSCNVHVLNAIGTLAPRCISLFLLLPMAT